MNYKQNYVDCLSCGERFFGDDDISSFIRLASVQDALTPVCTACLGGPNKCRSCAKEVGSNHKQNCPIRELEAADEVFVVHCGGEDFGRATKPTTWGGLYLFDQKVRAKELFDV